MLSLGHDRLLHWELTAAMVTSTGSSQQDQATFQHAALGTQWVALKKGEGGDLQRARATVAQQVRLLLLQQRAELDSQHIGQLTTPAPPLPGIQSALLPTAGTHTGSCRGNLRTQARGKGGYEDPSGEKTGANITEREENTKEQRKDTLV